MLELALMDLQMQAYLQSTLAASALFLSALMLKSLSEQAINLIHKTFNEGQYMSCMNSFIRVLKLSAGLKNSALRKKFSSLFKLPLQNIDWLAAHFHFTLPNYSENGLQQ